MGIIQASIPLFFVLIGVELAFAWHRHRPLYRLNDSLSDLSAGTLSQIAGIFTKVLLVGAYDWTFAHIRVQRLVAVPAWPDGPLYARIDGDMHWHATAIIGWIATFVAVDLAYYWFHRVSHEVNLFWAGHVVHHSSEEYNLAVALRQTAVGGLLSWVFYVPLALLGITLTQFVACYSLNLIYQFWIHTRAVDRLPRWAETVLNTPSHHRVHHGVNPEYQDRNYAGVLIVWDRWFGTFTPERQEPVFGLTTPLRSWNPLWAQIHQYVAIARNVRRAASWGDRWQYVFASPGWRPAAEGGPVVIPPVSSSTFLKFDPAVSTALAYYALVHFAFAVPPALLLLSNADRLSPSALAAGSFYVALTLTNVGGVLEGRRWALATEQARLLSLSAAAVAMRLLGMLDAWMAASAFAIGAVSLLVLWRWRAQFTMPSDERMDVGYR
ncbi:MAG: sterol desaturase family protein [Gemmatimonadaceae bacterium]|nr:sterol desaturase family protein [Gemmatimonadaceae bacterium]